MSTANESLTAAIKVVKSLNSLTLSYCSGTFPWNEDTTFFYKLEGESQARFLNFPATDSQLEDLLNASSEGEIDPENFGTSFSPWQEGIVGALQEDMLRQIGSLKKIGSKKIGSGKAMKVELSKLNVYGPGESPKADQVDDPAVIGSLVVILPTDHQGGSIIFDEGENERVFDSSTVVCTTPSPKAAFMAWYGDVDHRLKKITSGYLVTLTYNFCLKKGNKRELPFSSETVQDGPEPKGVLDSLLKNPAFFPSGGFIGFGLSHKYPFVLESTDLSEIKEDLRGSDAIISRACEALSLDTSIQAVYKDREDDSDAPGRAVLLDDPRNYNYKVEGLLIDHLLECRGQGVVKYKRKEATVESYSDDMKPIVWLRKSTGINEFTFFYLDDDYKRPEAHDVEADICLVAKVPPVQKRLAFKLPADHHQRKYKKRRLGK